MFLFKFAFKNLMRYRRRTLITAGALAYGIAMYLLIDSMLLGVELDSERNLIWYETASARVMHEQYWENKIQRNLKYAVEEPETIYEILEREDIPYAPRTVFNAEMIVYKDPFAEDGSIQATVFAIDPSRDDDVFKFERNVTAGDYLQAGDQGVMLGAWLAQDIGADIGYPITLRMRTKSGYNQAIDLNVVGIVDVPNPPINRTGIFMDLETADYFLEMEGAVSEINVSFPLLQDATPLTEELALLLPTDQNIEVLDWKVLGKDALAMAEAKQGGTGMILGLIFLIAAVGVSNTMLMAIFERTRELGTMRAMGMTDGQIWASFCLEAGGVGFLGGIFGMILGTPLVWFMVNFGLDFGWIIRDFDIGYRITGIMYGAFNPSTWITAFVVGIIACMFFALLPTWRAVRMQITDCLRD